jgi:anti-sigma factor RsiW
MSQECGAVREDLAEHAVGVLPPARRRAVSEHLGWCAGCRKEAGELAEGAAVLALSGPAQPPAGLEDRIVGAVARGTTRWPGPRVAMILAAAVAVASVGIVGAMAGRVRQAEDAAATARDRAESAAGRFAEVLEDVGASPVVSLPLSAAEGDAGGRAVLYDASEGRDFALVIVGGLPENGRPYVAYLVSPSGRRLDVGRLRPSGDGQLSRYRFFAELSSARDLVVVDSTGRTVLRADVPPA